MDTPRAVLLIIILIILFVFPDSPRTSSQSQQSDLDRQLSYERQAIKILDRTIYGSFSPVENRWINLTGLREEDSYAWDLLPSVHARAKEQIKTLTDGASIKTSSHYPAGSTIIKSNDGKAQNYPENKSDIWGPHHSVYQNVTGTVRGHWTRSRCAEGHSPPTMNLTTLTPYINYSNQKYSRNVTGSGGNLQIKLGEKDGELLESEAGSVQEIRAEMTIKDPGSSGDGWQMTLHGIHYPRQGGIVLSTTSQRFAGIFALPHFVLSMDDFLLAQQLLNKTLNSAIVQQEKSSGGVLWNPWSSSPNNPSEFLFPTPHCEYLVFLQQHPVSVTQLELDMIEKELRFPKGAPLPAAPDMRMSALIFSPDCGFILESQGPPDFTIQEGAHLIGMKLESYIRWGRQGILASAILLSAEIYLLKWQMNSTTTPSAKSRISFYSVVIMALGDGFACLSFLVSGMLLDATFLPLTAAGFLSFLCVSILGIRFLVDIWTVQAPERLERVRRTTAPSSVPTPIPTIAPAVITAAGVDTLPLPVTAARPINDNSIVILPPDQDLGAAEIDDAAAAEPTAQAGRATLQSEMGAMYSRFYFLLLAIFFLSLHATSWPTTIRSIYTNILSFTYLSFWVPQIYRNIIRNCRKAVRWEFILGQSLLRLAPFLYFYTVTDNILYVEPDKTMALILAAWVWIQFWAMESQNILGPRFFVSSGWAPPAYDYHPILHENEQESGTLPIGFHLPTSFGPTFYNFDAARRIPGGRIVHCAICMQDLEVPVVPADGDNAEAREGLVSTIFSRRAYMVTPCRHIFHGVCLEEWMQYRLQCPICRENLPPL